MIVLGMHHSGTSILAEVLHRHGVFMHANMRHYESKFFTRRVNNEVIMGGGAGWAGSPIMTLDEVLSKLDEARALVDAEAYRRYVKGGYDGRSRWGFKDPRTCVTLPLHLDLFPNAQLLHIVRDGDRVADSLARSRKKGVGVKPDRAFWKELWRQHVERAREFGRRHGRYYEFRYEDLTEHPVDTSRTIFDYLELPFTGGAGEFVKERIRPASEAASL